MRIAFLLESSFTNLGVSSLVACLKQKGHICELFIASEEADFYQSFRTFQPDVVGFSFMTGGHLWARETASRIRTDLPMVKIICGGVHPTLFPEIVEEYPIDAVCRGEGEEALMEYLDALASNGDTTHIQSLWVKIGETVYRNPIRPLLTDLDRLPDPDRECYAKYDYTRAEWDKYFSVGRGCAYRCTFCANHQFLRLFGSQNFIRRRSVKRVINEITSVHSKRKLHEIVFCDETFNLDQNWFDDFLTQYKDHLGIPMICSIGVETTDENQIKRLKESGCKIVIFGVESGNEQIRNEILKKPFRNDEMLYLSRLLHKYHLPFMTTNIIGIPGETISQAWETVHFNLRLRPLVAIASFLTPFPKTDIHDLAVQLGLIEPVNPDQMAPNLYAGTILKLADLRTFRNLHRLFTLMVKFPSFLPVFRFLTRLPPNAFFELLFILGFAYYQKAFYQRSLLSIAAYGFRNIRLFLKLRKK